MVRPAHSRLSRLLHHALAPPPEALRRGPFRVVFTSRLRSPRLTSQLGLALGVAFAICFVTGLLSHLIQHPPSWFWWPSRPVGLYRVTQGLHVATGLASTALLSVKLWSVYPKLRGLLTTVAATAGVVTLSTVGQTVPALRGISVLAPRRPDVGPQGLPVNTSAVAAGVLSLVREPGLRLTVIGPDRRVALSLADLAALPQQTVSLPITCVEGWSADGEWIGVRVHDLLALVGVTGSDATALVESLQRDSPYRTSILDAQHTADPLTLLALRLNGEVLHPDHGYPCRLIAPNRPGVMQTKWVNAIRVLKP